MDWLDKNIDDLFCLFLNPDNEDGTLRADIYIKK